jgi:hypothetical protein
MPLPRTHPHTRRRSTPAPACENRSTPVCRQMAPQDDLAVYRTPVFVCPGPIGMTPPLLLQASTSSIDRVPDTAMLYAGHEGIKQTQRDSKEWLVTKYTRKLSSLMA